MKYLRALAPLVLMTTLLSASLALAQSSGNQKKQQSDSKNQHKTDLSKAKDVVNRITPSIPQEVHRSTETANDVAHRESQKERQRQLDNERAQNKKRPSIDKINVRSPIDKNNPTGSPEVQRGFDQHQKEIKKKRQAEKKGS